MISVKRKVHFVRRPDKSRALIVTDSAPAPVAPGRVPRISRLMALAIHFDRLIREGTVYTTPTGASPRSDNRCSFGGCAGARRRGRETPSSNSTSSRMRTERRTGSVSF